MVPKVMEWEGVNWIHLTIGKSCGFREHGNKPSDYRKCGEFIDWLKNY
jgi:hypothetical protein